MTLTQIKSKIDEKVWRRKSLRQDLNDHTQTLATIHENIETLAQCQKIIHSTAQQTQEKLQYNLSQIVTHALNTIWPNEDWEFNIDCVIKRNKTEFDLNFINSEGNHIDPMSADGGGAVDITSFALRLSLWAVHVPGKRNLFILDEPLKFLSKDLQEFAALLLRELKEKMKIQFIIVSHDKLFIDAADRLFEVEKVKGVSTIRRK